MIRRLAFTAMAILVWAAPAPTRSLSAGPVIAIDRNRLTVDGAPTFLFFISYFDALRASPAAWEEDFTYLTRLGVTGVRIFPSWWSYTNCSYVQTPDTLFQFDGSLQPAVLGTLKAFLDAASAKGLLVDITFTRETVKKGDEVMSLSNYSSAMKQAAAALAGYRNVLFDVQNEYMLHDMTPREAAALVAEVHAADAHRITSASALDDGAVPAYANVALPAIDIVAYHDKRHDETWFTPQAASTQLSGIRAALSSVKPIHYQEPMPWSPFPGCASPQKDPVPTHARQAARSAKEHGAAGWTFHTRLSFNLKGTSLTTRLAADPPQKQELEAAVAESAKACWGCRRDL